MAKKIEISLTTLELHALNRMLMEIHLDMRTSKSYSLFRGKAKPAARRAKNKVYQAWLLLFGDKA